MKVSLVIVLVCCVGCDEKSEKSEYVDFVTATVTCIDGEAVSRIEQSSGAFFGNESVKIRSDAELFITATTESGEVYYFKVRNSFLYNVRVQRSVVTLAYALKKRMESSAVKIKFPKKFGLPWSDNGQTRYFFAEDFSGEVPIDAITILPREK